VPWFLGAHHVSNFAEIGRLIEFLVWGSGYSCFTWPLYIAIEPYVRRRWPVTLISWSRLLAGGIRDPLVGRDVLVGAHAAASIDAVGRVWWFIPSWLSHPPTQPFSGQFLGAHTIIASISDTLKNAPLSSLAAVCAGSSPRVAAQGVGGNVRIRSFADGLPLSVERAPPEFVVF